MYDFDSLLGYPDCKQCQFFTSEKSCNSCKEGLVPFRFVASRRDCRQFALFQSGETYQPLLFNF